MLLAALVNGAAAQIVVESMYADQAWYYLSIYRAAVEAIRGGQTTVMPGAPLSQGIKRVTYAQLITLAQLTATAGTDIASNP